MVCQQSCNSANETTIPKIILDTDLGSDADDLGALITLNNLHNAGECEILGVMSYFHENDVVAAINATNTFYGNADLPIGIRSKVPYSNPDNHTGVIARNFPHTKTNQDVPLAVELYRKILSAQEDNSVIIATVGPLGNIKALMESEADEYSDLNGIELLSKKVKFFTMMGGRYPSGSKEWNWSGNELGVTEYVLGNLKNRIVISGAENGESIRIGEEFNKYKKPNPLCTGFLHFSKCAFWVNENFKGEILNNASFDQITVLHAVYGDESPYWDIIEGSKCIVDAEGNTHWEEEKASNHAHMLLKEDVTPLRDLVLSLMVQDLE